MLTYIRFTCLVQVTKLLLSEPHSLLIIHHIKMHLAILALVNYYVVIIHSSEINSIRQKTRALFILFKVLNYKLSNNQNLMYAQLCREQVKYTSMVYHYFQQCILMHGDNTLRRLAFSSALLRL